VTSLMRRIADLERRTRAAAGDPVAQRLVTLEIRDLEADVDALAAEAWRRRGYSESPTPRGRDFHTVITYLNIEEANSGS